MSNSGMEETKTYKERFADWFDDQKAKGMCSFKPVFNLHALATKFGANLVKDEYGFDSYIDFSNTPYKTIMHPEVEEFIYKGLFEEVTQGDPTSGIRDLILGTYPDYRLK